MGSLFCPLLPSFSASGHHSCRYRRNPGGIRMSCVPWLVWAGSCLGPWIWVKEEGGFSAMMMAGGVMLQLSRVTTDCATTHVCACQGTGSAKDWLVHAVPGGETCLQSFHRISVFLSSCWINCLNVSVLIKFPVEDFRPPLVYSCLDIRKKGSLELESAGNAI